MESNHRFKQLSPEEMYFNECFAIPENETEGRYLTAAAIFRRIRQHAGAVLKNGNMLRFSHVLVNINGLQRRRTRRGTEYLVMPIV